MKHFLILGKKKYGYMALKLDMRKAYDRSDWDLIRKCFQDLGSETNELIEFANALQRIILG